jgi:hypothetical protein
LLWCQCGQQLRRRVSHFLRDWMCLHRVHKSEVLPFPMSC